MEILYQSRACWGCDNYIIQEARKTCFSGGGQICSHALLRLRQASFQRAAPASPVYFDSQPNLYVRGGGCRRSDGIVSEHVCCRRAARTLFAVRHRARRRRRRWTIRSSVALETLAAAGRPIRSPRGCRPSGRLESVCSLLESCPDGRRSCRCRHLAVKLVSKFSCLSNAFALHGTNHPSLTHLLKRFIAMQIPRNMMPSTIMIGSMFSGFV